MTTHRHYFVRRRVEQMYPNCNETQIRIIAFDLFKTLSATNNERRYGK